jgi:hypothetical protein
LHVGFEGVTTGTGDGEGESDDVGWLKSELVSYLKLQLGLKILAPILLLQYIGISLIDWTKQSSHKVQDKSGVHWTWPYMVWLLSGPIWSLPPTAYLRSLSPDAALFLKLSNNFFTTLLNSSSFIALFVFHWDQILNGMSNATCIFHHRTI